jgi:hypothetical protein
MAITTATATAISITERSGVRHATSEAPSARGETPLHSGGSRTTAEATAAEAAAMEAAAMEATPMKTAAPESAVGLGHRV